MSKYLPATLGIVAMLLASTALAKERRDDPLKSYATPFARSGSAFRPKKPQPLEQYTVLECVPVQATDTEDRDRIYKIVVNISFNDHIAKLETNGFGGQNVEISASNFRTRSAADRFHSVGRGAER